jgi:hypothetical protein
VLRGGFSLWLGDNIAILSMVKRSHPLLSNKVNPGIEVLHREDAKHREIIPDLTPPTSSLNSLYVGKVGTVKSDLLS